MAIFNSYVSSCQFLLIMLGMEHDRTIAPNREPLPHPPRCQRAPVAVDGNGIDATVLASVQEAAHPGCSLASRQQNFHELRVLKGGVLENLPIDFPILWVDFPINLHF